MSNANELADAMRDAYERADREQSTLAAGEDLRKEAKKMFKASEARDAIMKCIRWEPYPKQGESRQRADGRRYPTPQQASSFNPSLYQGFSPQFQHYQQQPMGQAFHTQIGGHSGMPSGLGGSLTAFSSSGSRMCTFCNKGNHPEVSCWAKFPHLRPGAKNGFGGSN